MAGKKKTAKLDKNVMTPEAKSQLKAGLKGLKAERDKALAEKDKKALKVARYKIKKLKRKVRKVVLPPAPEAKAEAPAESAG